MTKARFPEEKELNLNELTEFNPALVYGFDPEASLKYQLNSDIGQVMHDANQHIDMFNAYLYAQETVLPWIRQNGINNITAEKLIEWIKAIHFRIGSALAADLNFEKGQFTDRQVLRWHAGHQTDLFYYQYVSQPSESLLEKFVAENKLEKSTVKAFLTLLEQFRDNEALPFPEGEKPFIPWESPYIKGFLAVNRMMALFQAHQLSEAQLAVIQPILAFGGIPQEIPARMQKFAETLVAKWKTCSHHSVDELAEFAHYAFYHLTDIHPFANANGRTATCLMNIALRSFDKPSIMLRYPGEAADEKSAYSQAIERCDTAPELMIQHIKSRLLEEKPYYSEFLAAKTIAKVKISFLLLQMQNQFPKQPIQNIFHQICRERDEPLSNIAYDLMQEKSKLKTLKKPWEKLVKNGRLPELPKEANTHQSMLHVLQAHFFNEVFKAMEEKRKILRREQVTLSVMLAMKNKTNPPVIKEQSPTIEQTLNHAPNK